MQPPSDSLASVNPNSNVFLIVRFRESAQHEAIARTVSSILSEYSMNLLRADFRQYNDELWGNVQHYMNASAYGIAVFEEMTESNISLNVPLELGYMLAKDKRVLLLKEKNSSRLQADLSGHLYREFDSDNLEATVSRAVRSWLSDLGVAKRQDEKLVVFVSHGGTCRDPMAKAITRSLLRANRLDSVIRVEAVGIGDPDKPTASDGARQAISELLGEDLLADHRAARLTTTVIREADLILLMAHSLMNPKQHPPEKTFVFKPFFGFAGDVADPWPDGSDEATRRRYASTAQELFSILSTGIDRLTSFLGVAKSESTEALAAQACHSRGKGTT